MYDVIWSPGVSLEKLEQMAILKSLKFNHGNKVATANALGIAIRTLDSRLEKYEQETNESEQRNADRDDAQREYLLRARGLAPDQLNPRSPWVCPGSEGGGALGVESSSISASTQAMPMSERQDVQGVLHEHSADLRAKGQRRRT